MAATLLARLAQALDAAGIAYMIIGGQAVLLYGEPRQTRDVDITLGVDVDALPAVLRVVAACELELLVDPAEFVPRTLVLPCHDPASGYRVDLIFSFSPYERQALARTTIVHEAGQPLRYASLEDLLLQKLVAGRPRDLEDARVLLLKHPELEEDYLLDRLTEFEAVVDRPLVETFRRLRGR